MALEHHGISMKEAASLGEAINPVSTGIIAMVCKGRRKTTAAADEKGFLRVKNLIEAKDVFAESSETAPNPVLDYLEAIFLESEGDVLVRVCEADPTKDDVEAMHTCTSTGLTPSIFICPEKSKDFESELSAQARNFGGVALIDLKGDDTYAPTASQDASYFLFSWLKSSSQKNFIPAACAMAGLMRRVDFWLSPSNKVFRAVKAIEDTVEWSLTKANTKADQLNKKNITVMINENGVRPWGNRMGNGAFINVYRIKNAVSASIAQSTLWAIDNNITKALIQAVTESVNNYLRDLKSIGAILGGSCFVSPEKNPTDKVKDGKITFDYELTPPYPAEQMSFTLTITDERLKEVFNV